MHKLGLQSQLSEQYSFETEFLGNARSGIAYFEVKEILLVKARTGLDGRDPRFVNYTIYINRSDILIMKSQLDTRRIITV